MKSSYSLESAGWVAAISVLAALFAGCATEPPPPGTPLGTHPLAIFQSGLPAAPSGNDVQPEPRQTVGSVQQRESFATLETYVTLLARSDALDNVTCRQASEAAIKELRGMPASEPALRLALIAGCPAASADAVQLAADELGQFERPLAEREAARGGEAAVVPEAIAALARVWRAVLERRLALVGRVTRDRASVAEYEGQIASLREEMERSAAARATERREARRVRDQLGAELVLMRESLAAAREKLEAVSRIERAVQQAGEAVDVQGGWAEMAPPGAGEVAGASEAPVAGEAPAAREAPAANGAPVANEAPVAIEEPADDGGPSVRQRPRGGTNNEESPASPTTNEQN